MGINFGSARPCSPCMSPPPPPPPPPPPACPCAEFSTTPDAPGSSLGPCTGVSAGIPALNLTADGACYDNYGAYQWSGPLWATLPFNGAGRGTPVYCGWSTTNSTLLQAVTPPADGTSEADYGFYWPAVCSIGYLGSNQWWFDYGTSSPTDPCASLATGPASLPISLDFSDYHSWEYSDGTNSIGTCDPAYTPPPGYTLKTYVKVTNITVSSS